MSKLKTIYKYNQKGKVQEWTIVVEGNTFYTIEGIQGGKLTTSLPTICLPKNTGKKNETSGEEQAIKEAQAKWQKKLDKGYNEILSAEKKFFEPMLAEDYKKSKNVDFTKTRVFVQVKLDGLRCIGQNNTLMSRNGKPYVACPHLQQNSTLLDGELYTHSYHDDFNKIVSLCKKQDPTEEELMESAEKVEYWLYDFPSHKGVFSERFKALQKWRDKLPTAGAPEAKFGKSIFKLVPTFEVFSKEDIDRYHKKFLKEGYEGTIVRLDIGEYENKRSKQLLKYKDFIDEEFEITGYEEGTGGRTGTIGKFVIKLADGQSCESNVKGDFPYLKQVWKDRDIYIGKKATIKFFGYTPAGKLRFPYIIKLNREEYE